MTSTFESGKERAVEIPKGRIVDLEAPPVLLATVRGPPIGLSIGLYPGGFLVYDRIPLRNHIASYAASDHSREHPDMVVKPAKTLPRLGVARHAATVYGAS